jgi:hypothetical protein
MAAVGLATAAGLAAAGPAGATPPETGCPSGFDVLNVAELTAIGYRVPAQVDDPSSGVLTHGRPGNGNGTVCGHEFENQLTPSGNPLYNFFDDNLPAGG